MVLAVSQDQMMHDLPRLLLRNEVNGEKLDLLNDEAVHLMTMAKKLVKIRCDSLNKHYHLANSAPNFGHKARSTCITLGCFKAAFYPI